MALYKPKYPKSNIHVHHLDYDSIGNERFTDLMVVCVDCHEKLHRFINKMVKKGFNRRAVMKRLKPYCIRKIMLVHQIHGGFSGFAKVEDWML